MRGQQLIGAGNGPLTYTRYGARGQVKIGRAQVADGGAGHKKAGSPATLLFWLQKYLIQFSKNGEAIVLKLMM